MWSTQAAKQQLPCLVSHDSLQGIEVSLRTVTLLFGIPCLLIGQRRLLFSQ